MTYDVLKASCRLERRANLAGLKGWCHRPERMHETPGTSRQSLSLAAHGLGSVFVFDSCARTSGCKWLYTLCRFNRVSPHNMVLEGRLAPVSGFFGYGPSSLPGLATVACRSHPTQMKRSTEPSSGICVPRSLASARRQLHVEKPLALKSCSGRM